MRFTISRLWAGFFCALVLAGCPHPVPAKPAAAPVQVLWYAWDWKDPAAFDPAKLQAAGVTGVMAVSPLLFAPQNEPLSLDRLRADAKEVQAHTGSLSVLWSFHTARQAGNPTPGSPTRTLCDPRDQAQRAQLLGNWSNIGRVAREVGFAGVALDTENMAGGVTWPDEKGAKELGGDLARAIRQNYPECKLAAFGPLTGATDGFKHVWRGFNQAAGDAVFFSEDTYGLSGLDAKGIKQSLNRCGDLTGARYPAAGWYASTKAPDVPGWWKAAEPQLAAASRISPYVMVYREGAMNADQQAALTRTLRAVRP